MYFCIDLIAMIKQVLHKAFSVLLALLVLVSTVSFTIVEHYCGNTLVDAAIFQKAKTCGMDMDATANCLTVKKDCCKDEVVVVKGQKELKFSSFEDFDFQQQLFITFLANTYIHLFEGIENQTYPHKYYSPPHLVADIHVLDQVFLI